jgi:4-hydroxybenzoate polyprenyltransferase
VVAAVALVAGGDSATAFRLGLSMAALQFAIGALNDIIDAPADAGRVPPKPIPSGAVSVVTARGIVVAAVVLGLALGATAGPAVLTLAVVVLGVGVAYDLWAKGTPWSWLPFAVGIPLLPVYGWVGATGSPPGFFAVLVPMAVLAGAALAIANARVDLDADRASGTRSVATALGAERSWWLGAFLMAGATLLGVLFVGRSGWTWPVLALVAGGTAVVGIGLAIGRGGGPAARRRAWEAQAVGAAIAATGWVAGMLPGP